MTLSNEVTLVTSIGIGLCACYCLGQLLLSLRDWLYGGRPSSRPLSPQALAEIEYEAALADNDPIPVVPETTGAVFLNGSGFGRRDVVVSTRIQEAPWLFPSLGRGGRGGTVEPSGRSPHCGATAGGIDSPLHLDPPQSQAAGVIQDMDKNASVGEVRRQSALMEADQPVIVKCGERYYRTKKVWPDTFMAPGGRGFYVEIEETPFLDKTP